MRNKTSPEGPDRSPEGSKVASKSGAPAVERSTGDLDREVVGAEIEILPTKEIEREVDLDQCDREIRAGWDLAKSGAESMLEGLLLVASALDNARRLKPQNDEFGKWFAAQKYPFGLRYANRLRKLGEHAEEAREFVERTFAETGEVPTRTRMINAVTPPRHASGTGGSERGKTPKERRPTAKTVTADECRREVEDLLDEVAALVDERRDGHFRLSLLVVITDAESSEELLRSEVGPASPPDMKGTTKPGRHDK